MIVRVEVGSYSNWGIVRFRTSPRELAGSFLLGDSLRIIVWYKVVRFWSIFLGKRDWEARLMGVIYCGATIVTISTSNKSSHNSRLRSSKALPKAQSCRKFHFIYG